MLKNAVLKKQRSCSRLKLEEFLSSSFKHMPKFSYGQRKTGNLILKGDNLVILKALLPYFEGAVNCIYIDPPYNNQERYAHYSDDFSHERWLKSITLRLEYLSHFLNEGGSLWISIDDREAHYLKVAADKVFGRENFITTIIWEQRTTRENRKVFSNNHEYILVYAKNAKSFKNTRNLIPITPEISLRYKNPDNDPRGPWQSVSANVQAGHATPAQFYEITSPNGGRHAPPKGRCWVYNSSRMKKEIANNNIWFGRNGDGVPRIKKFLFEAQQGLTPETLWKANHTGTNDSAKKHLLKLFPRHKVFDTPKPEELIQRILHIATNPGDLVLDAYLGSGTTTAVAHKMKRRYMGIEEGSHAMTHCAKRMQKVVDNEIGGISESEAWSGGGGFDFYDFAKCK